MKVKKLLTTILIKINPLKVDIKLTLFMGVQLRTLCHAASYCYARLYDFQRAVTRASLALFLRRTNTSSVLHALRAFGTVESGKGRL